MTYDHKKQTHFKIFRHWYQSLQEQWGILESRLKFCHASMRKEKFFIRNRDNHLKGKDKNMQSYQSKHVNLLPNERCQKLSEGSNKWEILIKSLVYLQVWTNWSKCKSLRAMKKERSQIHTIRLSAKILLRYYKLDMSRLIVSSLLLPIQKQGFAHNFRFSLFNSSGWWKLKFPI